MESILGLRVPGIGLRIEDMNFKRIVLFASILAAVFAQPHIAVRPGHAARASLLDRQHVIRHHRVQRLPGNLNHRPMDAANSLSHHSHELHRRRRDDRSDVHLSGNRGFRRLHPHHPGNDRLRIERRHPHHDQRAANAECRGISNDYRALAKPALLVPRIPHSKPQGEGNTPLNHFGCILFP